MRIVATGDWHLAATFDGLDLTTDALRAVDEMIEYIVRERVQHVVCLGDLFHYPKPNAGEPGSKTIVTAINMVRRIANAIVSPVIDPWMEIIPGNHDLFERADALDGLAVIEAACIPGVQVIRDVEVVPDVGVMVPYMPRYTGKADSLGAQLAPLVEQGHRLFFGHLNLDGMVPGPEDVIERGHGGSYLPSWPTDALQGHGVTIVGGHYHNRSIITRGDVTIHHPGSMSRMNCGEIGDRKGFLAIESGLFVNQ